MQLHSGRINQKARTRKALLEAARRLMDRGETVTVPAVANEAGISRATAYRYFPAADVLTMEAALDGHVATPEEVVDDAVEVRDRVLRVQRYLLDVARRRETQFRLFLARAQDTWIANGGNLPGGLRGGRRLAMYAHALQPVKGRLDRRTFDTLVRSLSAVSGVESHIALKDVCRVDDRTADEIASGIVLAILDRFLPPECAANGAGRER